MRGRMTLVSGLVMFLMAGGVGRATASGFGVFTQGASALGQAAAVTAHGDGPSAVFYNPAQINGLSGTQFEIGTTLIIPDREFSGAGGASAETKDSVFYPSTLYLTHQVNDRLSVGLGVFSPFGLGTDWGETWSGRYLATKSEVETYTVNPVISWQPVPWLSLAAGVDLLYLDATLQKKVNTTLIATALNLVPPGTVLPDTGQKFSGDGTGLGYNLAALFTPAERVSVGISYRSPIRVDVKGDVDFATVPGFDPLFPDSDGKTHITLPQQLTAGVACAVTDRLLLEAGVRWEDWSSFDQLKLKLGAPVLGQTVDVQPRDWHDTFAVNLGGSYRLTSDLTLMAGYLYGNDPVPDSTFEPAIPDSDSHLFSVGGSYRMDRVRFSMSYAYQLMEKRTKEYNVYSARNFSTGADGTYESSLHLLAVSLGYIF